MKRFLKSICLSACVAVAGMAVSCNNDNDLSWEEERENELKDVAEVYVNQTVIPTYEALADNAMELAEICQKIEESVRANESTDVAADGTFCAATQELIKQACEKWYAARKYWELSEAWLFGAAADYYIDPHIDSWPLDAVELQQLLNDPARMEKMNADYAANFLGYGLLGFHAVEYMIFDLNADKTSVQGNPRTASYKRVEEAVYLSAVAEDLSIQCVRLNAAWAGLDAVSSEKQDILEEAELDVFDYGYSMCNAGKGGSKYVNFLEVAQEILVGASDIADEVANQKIGRPNTGTSGDDLSYIESPYAKNSKQDFYDNIMSVKNAYEGYYDGKKVGKSVGDYLQNADDAKMNAADKKVREAIASALAAIEAAPAPFVNYAGSNNELWAKATEECNNLADALTEAESLIE
ncbi:MAG: hypothetical protein NC048_00200 [Bacteroides sp.]|nr:hypothetical protein [Bacteroides sp.]MCM1530944.1 hypothetical protein [Ruminococcus flavefaciens]MCM1553906.1 hypothetical protein [Bacteroides sp.]